MLLIFQVFLCFSEFKLQQPAVTVVPCLTAEILIIHRSPVVRRLGLLARQVRGESRETRRSPGDDFWKKPWETTKKIRQFPRQTSSSKSSSFFSVFCGLLVFSGSPRNQRGRGNIILCQTNLVPSTKWLVVLNENPKFAHNFDQPDGCNVRTSLLHSPNLHGAPHELLRCYRPGTKRSHFYASVSLSVLHQISLVM